MKRTLFLRLVRLVATVFLLAGGSLRGAPVVSSTGTSTWTNGSGVPIWGGFYSGNWSPFGLPSSGQTVILPANFTPSSFDQTLGLNPNGSQILLATSFDLGQLPRGIAPNFNLSPTAGNIVFLNSWTLIQETSIPFLEPTQLPSTRSAVGGLHGAGLTLTQGNLFVGSQMTVTIDANLTLASGLLTKTGSGTLLLEETVNGNIEVLQGTLGGNFTEFGSLVNLATLSPGNSPGTITVYGNFQQARGGTLNIELASSTLYDRLIVAGRAQLGGTLDISLLNGFTPKQGEKFDFLSAGGIAGTFSKIDAPVWNDLTLRPFYGKNSVTIRAVVDSFANLSGLTPNEHAVGQTLDSMISDPRAANLINYLYGRSLADLPKDLERLSPDQLTSMGAFSIAYAQVQSLNLQRRTDDIRSGANGFSAANFAMNGFNPNYSGSMSFGSAGPNGNELSLDDGKDMKATKEVAPAESRWGAFVSGTGEWVNVEGTDNAHGYDIASGGFTLGVDYKLTPNLAIGLGAGYTGATADLTDHGRVWINGGKLGIYGTFFQNTPGAAPAPTMSKDSSKDSSKEAPAPAPSAGGGFYADFAAFGGFNGYSTRRDALEGEARGDTSGGEVDALFGAGYDIKKGNLTFGPTASFNYTYAGTRAFTEHDSLAPLDVHGLDTDSLRTAFGGKLSYECKCGSLLIKPELRLAWQHEFGDTAYTLDSSFASGAGGNFTTTGPRLGRDSLLVGAGFAIQINDRCSTYLYYDGELARRNYELNAVTGGFRIAF